MPHDTIPPPHTTNGVQWFGCLPTESAGLASTADSGMSRPELFGDGPPIPDAIRRRIVNDVRACLTRGLWRLASRAAERAREPGELDHSRLAGLKPDGPRLSVVDADVVARCVEVHLLAMRVATAARTLLIRRTRTADTSTPEPITRSSPIAALGIASHQIERLESTLVPTTTVGELADNLEAWRIGSKRAPYRIGQSEQGELMLALERVGLLGPVCAAYLEKNRAKRDDFKQGRWWRRQAKRNP
ncbi:MAG: hypothetical protein RL745_986 [Actinomycetota bacterium]